MSLLSVRPPFLAAGLVLLVAVGCRRESVEPPPPAVAWLGEEPLALPELEAELERLRSETEETGELDDEALADLRAAVLESLIDRRLLAAEATRLGIEVSEAEVVDALRRRGGRTEVDDNLRARAREQVLVDKLLLREVVARTALDPEAARTWYDAHPEAFEGGEELHLLHLMVRERDQAEALRRELLRGKDFAALAKEHSVAPDGQAGGDLGFVSRGTLPEELEEACFKLRKGQLSEVVESPWGFHLCRAIDRREGRVTPFEEVESRIEAELLREAVSRGEEAFVERLRKKSGVRIVLEVLDSIGAPPSAAAGP